MAFIKLEDLSCAENEVQHEAQVRIENRSQMGRQ
jgi:hypothetical protein